MPDCQSQSRTWTREVEAEQDKLANDKRVAADLEIAQKQNELKLKQAAP